MSSSLTNKILYIFTAVIILAVISIGVYAATNGFVPAINPGHNSTQIYIQYSGGYVNLQNALDKCYLTTSLPSISSYDSLPVSTPYHLASQILINVTSGGTAYKMTLQEAVNNNVFINGASQSYTTTVPAGGDYASNINVNTTNGIMTLQNAIDNKLLCSSPSCVGNVGQQCYPSGTSSSCTNPGTIQCDGSCSGYTYFAFGTQSSCSSETACNGNGNCQGWSGYGCGNCIFGSFSQAGYSYCYLCSSGGHGPTTSCSSPYQGRSTWRDVWTGTFWLNGPGLPVHYYFMVCHEGHYDYNWQIKP